MSNISSLYSHSLVLNKAMIAISTVSVKKAITYVCNEKARFLDVFNKSYALMDIDQWMDTDFTEHNDFLVTTQGLMKTPEIVVLTNYPGFKAKGVKLTRRNLWKRDQCMCQYCGKKPRKDEITIDHVIPQSRGGRSIWENVVLACFRCNSKKNNKTPVEAGMRLRRDIIDNGERKTQFYDKPQKPKWHAAYSVPASQYKASWKSFLGNIDEIYWDIELER